MIKYPDIVAVYKISDRANAKKFMKIFKNTLIDKVIDNKSRSIPKGAKIVDLGVGKDFKKKWKAKHKIYTLTK